MMDGEDPCRDETQRPSQPGASAGGVFGELEINHGKETFSIEDILMNN